MSDWTCVNPRQSRGYVRSLSQVGRSIITLWDWSCTTLPIIVDNPLIEVRRVLRVTLIVFRRLNITLIRCFAYISRAILRRTKRLARLRLISSRGLIYCMRCTVHDCTVCGTIAQSHNLTYRPIPWSIHATRVAYRCTVALSTSTFTHVRRRSRW